jgi:hypothetical protein
MCEQKVILYTSLGCHLCEEALALLRALQEEGKKLLIKEVEIAESEALVEAYGIRIPVLKREDEDKQTELGWPFDLDTLRIYLSVTES